MVNKKLLLLTAIAATVGLQSMEITVPLPLPPLRTRLAMLKKYMPDAKAFESTSRENEAAMFAVYGGVGQNLFRFDAVLYLTFLGNDALSTAQNLGLDDFVGHIGKVENNLRYRSAALITAGLLTQEEVPVALARVEKLQRRIAETAEFDEADGAECKVQ